MSWWVGNSCFSQPESAAATIAVRASAPRAIVAPCTAPNDKAWGATPAPRHADQPGLHDRPPLRLISRLAVDGARPRPWAIFLVTDFGKPFTANGFGNWLRARCDEARLPECTAHGLGKAGATIAAENGATDRQLVALYDWTSEKQANTYTAAANRKRLAADAAKYLAGGLELEQKGSHHEYHPQKSSAKSN
jgi:hypothetical protein